MKSIGELFARVPVLRTKVSGETLIRNVSSSSAEVKLGSLFVALPGAKHDGHDFLRQAVDLGAVGLVVEQQGAFEAFTNTLLVRSTHEALGFISSAWYGDPSLKMNVIGVTGTQGKTTTTYLIRDIWNTLGRVPGIIGTVEYAWGNHRERSRLTTPSQIELQELFSKMLNAGVENVSMEVSSIALKQARTAGTRFQTAVFTNLGQDHLDYHLDLENYFQSKKQLFGGYGLSSAVVNIDDSWGRRLLAELSLDWRRFSLRNPTADFYFGSLLCSKSGISGQVISPFGKAHFESPLVGEHNAYNCLAALSVSGIRGQGDLNLALSALRISVGAPGRLERVVGPFGASNVFVDYAHKPDALKSVLTALRDIRESKENRIITVFGCGGDRDKLKRPKMGQIASRMSEITIVTSDNPRSEPPERIMDEIEKGIDMTETRYIRESNRGQAIRLALSLARTNDLVLVAGKGHESYQIVGDQEFPFDDREVISEYLSQCTLQLP